jgi:hypothetical protein
MQYSSIRIQVLVYGPLQQDPGAGAGNRQGDLRGVTNVGTNLTSGFNAYGIDWVPGKSITYFLNGLN